MQTTHWGFLSLSKKKKTENVYNITSRKDSYRERLWRFSTYTIRVAWKLFTKHTNGAGDITQKQRVGVCVYRANVCGSRSLHILHMRHRIFVSMSVRTAASSPTFSNNRPPHLYVMGGAHFICDARVMCARRSNVWIHWQTHTHTHLCTLRAHTYNRGAKLTKHIRMKTTRECCYTYTWAVCDASNIRDIDDATT